LLETIRKGRVMLLNEAQATAFLVVSALGLAMWPLLSNVVPISMPPSCPPPIAALFSMVYIPCIALSMLFSEDHEGVMKNTPRKSSYTPRSRDESRFLSYLILRSLVLVGSVLITGILASASVFRHNGESFAASLDRYHWLFQSTDSDSVVIDSRGFWLVQDAMSCTAVVAVVGQSFSMLTR
jgi:hypothetical protein